jgi:hypothetical protein
LEREPDECHQDCRYREENAMNADTSSKRQVLTGKVKHIATLYHPRTWKEKGLWWTAGLFLITYLVVVVLLGIYWSRSVGRQSR